VKAASRWLVVLGATPAVALALLWLAGARPAVTVLSGTGTVGSGALGAAYVMAWLLVVSVTPGALLGAVGLVALARAFPRPPSTGR
jgi:hypothetical protein